MGWRWVVLAMLAIAGLPSCTGTTRTSAARTDRPPSVPALKPTAGQVSTGTGPIDPSVFASGACVAFGPTSGDRHLTVFLDAGHGGPDPGAVGTTESGQTVHEADLTLPIELDTMEALRGRGFRVVVSRTGSNSVARLGANDMSGDVFSAQGVVDDVAARANCANMGRADVLVGIYLNAGGSTADGGSITGYDAIRPFSNQNLRLADLVQRDTLAAMNAQGWDIPDDGVIEDSLLGSAVNSADQAYGHLILLGPAKTGYFATPSVMPGALIEPLFITDPFEASIASSSGSQEVIADGLAEALGDYFDTSQSGRG
jgi:N-acetylmuramoyl-L-alanine amidase